MRLFLHLKRLLLPRSLIPLCVPSSETVSAHNQGPWWDQLSISSHKRIDLVQHGVAHVCTHTRIVFVEAGVLWEIRDCLYIVSSVVCVLVCSGHALKGELYVRMCVCILSVSIKCCLFPMGSCIVKAAITLLSFGFFRHYMSLSYS